MLTALSIRDIVLIDRLDLSFHDGLCVLTGETGAGKSILLDALGLALGDRAETRLLRHGAAQAAVTAVFEVGAAHPALARIAEQGLDPIEDGQLVLRRTLTSDGRSRAFLNDQPVSAGLLRQVGDALVEIQGQHEQQGLLNPASHRVLLDAHGGLEAARDGVGRRHAAWRQAEAALAEARAGAEAAAADEAFLRHAVEELDGLRPEPGEEARLVDERTLLMNAGKVLEALDAAAGALSGEPGAEPAVGRAQRALDRIAETAGGRVRPILDALGRALAELAEASAELNRLHTEIEADPERQQALEDRLFALRDLARKHGVAVDALPALRDELGARLSGIADSGARLEALARDAETARQAYDTAADALSAARRDAAARLDAAVAGELAPLKLERARFHTRVEPLDEPAWGPAGKDRVAFQVATNPGSPPGPLARIASGGELSRFLLALKVVLAGADPVPTLVFDEVDAGVGGATASAVGDRLAQLARDVQVLVVTHSPQVAARGGHHWQVRKHAVDDRVATDVAELGPDARREEIARMLAGAEITAEARAAAERLLGAA